MQARGAAEGTRTRDARGPAPVDTEVVAIRRRSQDMSEQAIKKPSTPKEPVTRSPATAEKPAWEKPKMEDVSEEVMAQPYIRFT